MGNIGLVVALCSELYAAREQIDVSIHRHKALVPGLNVIRYTAARFTNNTIIPR